VRFNVHQYDVHLMYGGRRRWFTVIVHDTLEQMRRAAVTRMDDASSLATAGAIFQPALIRQRYVDGAWVDSAPTAHVGTMRLVLGHITAEVVAHECVHAALTIFRRDIGDPVIISDDVFEHEEHLAHIAGELIARTSDALHERDMWS